MKTYEKFEVSYKNQEEKETRNGKPSKKGKSQELVHWLIIYHRTVPRKKTDIRWEKFHTEKWVYTRKQ